MTTVLIIFLAMLSILWFADEILTILDIKKFGIAQEKNPIIKVLLGESETLFTLFKISSLAIFIVLIFLLKSIQPIFAIILTGIALFMYLIVVIRNFEIYKSSN